MKKKFFTIITVSSNSRKTQEYRLPYWILQSFSVVGALFVFSFGYFVHDYLELQVLKKSHHSLVAENNNLKSEARLLMTHLETVKSSLRRVQDYTSKLSELTKLNTEKIVQKTGIGPLSKEEAVSARTHAVSETDVNRANRVLPSGINLDQLVFRPLFNQLDYVGQSSHEYSLKLQSLLSTLSEQKSLLSSIPASSPLENGWITSKFGSRVSPFTGDLSQHKGLDIAAPVGTPVYAPADGVVVFVGAKEGYGNFIVLAHGYGVVSGYGHNAQNLVSPGQIIHRSDKIATVGQTGRTTGPHLHYEIWVNGLVANPEKFILNMDELGVYE